MDGVISQNYFMRHWYGQLSLRVSCWVSGFFLCVVTFILWKVLTFVTVEIQSNYTMLFFWGTVWDFSILSGIWFFVGISRSAARHIKKTKRKFWGRTARLVSICSLLFIFYSFYMQGIPSIEQSITEAKWLNSNGKWSITLLGEGKEMEVSGGIGYGFAQDFARVLAASPKVDMIHVNVERGGLIGEAFKARAIIKQHHLNTYTSTTCVSACTIMYLGGTKRFLKKGAKLGFHAVSVPGFSSEDVNEALSAERNYMASLGISDEFIQHTYDTPASSMWYPTEEELSQNGVVTDVTNGYDFDISGMSDISLPEFEKIILKDKVFSALKKLDPKLYDEMLSNLFLGMKDGMTMTELQASSLPMLQKLRSKYLAYSSADTLFKFTQLIIDEYKALNQISGIECNNYATGTDNTLTVKAIEDLPPGLQKQEQAILADVFQTADLDTTIPTEYNVKMIVQDVLTVIGDDAIVLSKIKDPSMDPLKKCPALIHFFETVLSLPPEKGEALLRWNYRPK